MCDFATVLPFSAPCSSLYPKEAQATRTDIHALHKGVAKRFWNRRFNLNNCQISTTFRLSLIQSEFKSFATYPYVAVR